MKYWEFISSINPIIGRKGWAFLATTEALDTIVNVCVQIIYSAYKWRFLMEEVIIQEDDWVSSGNYFEYNTDYPIRVPILFEWDNSAKTQYTWVSLRFLLPTTIKDKYVSRPWENRIISNTKLTWLFAYYREYTQINYKADTSIEIPLPNSHIPALHYLVLSQLEMIYAQQREAEETTNYQKYQSLINNLKIEDPQSTIALEWINYK